MTTIATEPGTGGAPARRAARAAVLRRRAHLDRIRALLARARPATTTDRHPPC